MKNKCEIRHRTLNSLYSAVNGILLLLTEVGSVPCGIVINNRIYTMYSPQWRFQIDHFKNI